LPVLICTSIGAGGFAPSAAAYDERGLGTTGPTMRPAATPPVAADFGPDCSKGSDALTHADEVMSGKLVLPRHRAVSLPRNPTWAEDPLNDRNWEFQYHSLRFVWDLFEAWRITRKEAYRDRGLYLVRDWVRDNPRGAGRSDFSWNDHSTAWRTLVLACAAVIAPTSRWVRDALRTHAATLADPGFYVRHGNHALNQSRGLMAAGCLLDRHDWQRLAAARIGTLLADSVDAQGVTNEQSIFYQLYNLTAYRAAADRLDACGMAVPRAFRRLDRMTELLTHATLPDGTYATLGDTGHGRARAIRGTIAEYAATGGREGPMPTARFATFDAGFAFGRTGWGAARAFEDEVAWSARFGPGRAFHGHLDHGAVTLYGYGRRLVDDPGLFTMNNNRWRAFAISRAAHNVVTVDGSRYTSSSAATLARSKTAATHDDITIVDPGYAGVDLRRRVVFSHGLGWLLVDDRAESVAVRTYRQLWHLLPGADPRRDGSSVRTRQSDGNVIIFQLSVPDRVRVMEGRRSPLQGWYSTALNRRKPAPTVEAVLTGRTVRYVTLLVPLPRPDAEVRLSRVSLAQSRIRFTLTVDGRREHADVTRNAVKVTTPPNDPSRPGPVAPARAEN
jgi:Heparinase II/III-like protein/Heparinase II/III N-terminus